MQMGPLSVSVNRRLQAFCSTVHRKLSCWWYNGNKNSNKPRRGTSMFHQIIIPALTIHELRGCGSFYREMDSTLRLKLPVAAVVSIWAPLDCRYC